MKALKRRFCVSVQFHEFSTVAKAAGMRTNFLRDTATVKALKRRFCVPVQFHEFSTVAKEAGLRKNF